MIEKEAFIAALLPICDTVCEYDRTRGKLRVRKTDLASGLEDKWYTVEELRDIFRDNGGVSAEKSVWMRYLSSENLRSFFYEKERNESFRLRFRQGSVGCRQYDIRIDRINNYVLVISGRDTQEQEIDALTGALSRNHYQRDMSNEIYRGGVALIDMDDLKLYNDINGHQVGDNALRVLADTIYEVVGCSGSLVRYGGDEFLLLLPGVEQAAFATVLGDIQRRLRTVSIPGCEGCQHITISVGCVMAQQETIAQAVQRADRLMYRAKRRKDAVVTEDSPAEWGEEIKPHILVVDDAAMNRAILREMLAEDFDVLEAEDGRQCMAQLETYGADISLVLLDMVMPELDGLQVLEEMNKRGFIEDIPVIIITADGSEEKVRQAYDMGVADYIERPFDIRIVRQRVINTVKLYARQRRLAAVMTQQLRRQEHTMGIAADILSRVMGYRNGEGEDHGRHVEKITQRLLQRMLERTDKYGLTLQDCRRAAAAAMFHDIGKMGVPDSLLRKPGPLTPEEFDEIKKHTLIGEELMRGMKEMESEPLVEVAAEICRWHHERVDGSGYPDGLKGDEIPMTVQAVGLVDAYDALVSQRVYKPAYTHAEALAMIRRGECGAFDPLLVDCLEDIQGALCREVYGLRGKE